jgi:hypothetical protein
MCRRLVEQDNGMMRALPVCIVNPEAFVHRPETAGKSAKA